jgi:hypothetical protein
MPPGEQQPWFHAAIGLLDVRRQDRLLAIGVDSAQARDLATLVGNRGALTLVMPDRHAAEAVAALALEQVTVLALRVVPCERFGTFDAMLVATATGPLLPPGAYADLARANLRPGGRFVVDVPGLDMVPDLRGAWAEVGFAAERLAPLLGMADDQLAEVLRGAGLRNVQGVLGAHLLHNASPADLVDTFASALDLTDAERLQLTHALVRRRGGTGPLDALVHRTRICGLR